jgi:pyruvate,water dikinase
MAKSFIREMRSLTIKDVPEAGGKNASLGEMLKVLTPKGVNIPDGFVITATAYRHFINEGMVKELGGKKVNLKHFIKDTLEGLNTRNVKDLYKRGRIVREAIISAELPNDLKRQIVSYYRKMEKQYFPGVDVAVRSSATAEDLPGASFAGQQETYLNVVGEENLLVAVRKCIASLFTGRAISYREDKGFDHLKIALSVGVQKMVRSDKAASGVIFTLDTESGFKDIILVTATWGLGELIVQGEIIPDEYIVYKSFLENKDLVPIISKKHGSKDRKMIYSFSGKKSTKIINTTSRERRAYVLTDSEIMTLSKWAQMIEDHYTRVRKTWTPMDIEWAKDGKTGKLYIVQARPETVQAGRDFSIVKEYERLGNGRIICQGTSVGSKIATGKANMILDVKGIEKFKPGEVLVTDMTDPDWEPIMKIASAIVTDKGGRTSHAAIVSRELGIPCIVGTETATRKIKNGQMITVDTTGSEGYVFDGALKFKVVEHNVKKIPKLKTKIAMNIATPDTAFEKSFLPNSGVGLAREEFIIASDIGIHPMALIEFKELEKKARRDSKVRKIINEIEKKTAGARDKKIYYVNNLAYGIAKIGVAFYPKDVIVRFSDFKTNEYRQLVGGELYEPQEENPMIGWRGASRYYHPAFAPAFALEVKAIKKVREEMGLTNVQVMVPVCRTVEEGKKVIGLMGKYGLKRKGGFKIYVMCEIPSNVILADRFLDIFDGMSIGSNDLTQMTLGLDRDGIDRIKGVGNENDESVKTLISQVIKKCNARKKYVGICGQAPSDYPDFAKFLVEEGIQSISLNPDSVVKTILYLSKNK